MAKSNRQLALELGVSHGLVGRKRRQGKSDAIIAEEAAARRILAESAKPKSTFAAGDRPGGGDYGRGVVAGYIHARTGVRSLTDVLSGMRPEFVEERIATLALIDLMLDVWLDAPENDTERLPRIDWRRFTRGTTPKAARQLFESLQRSLKFNEDEVTNTKRRRT